MGITTVLSDFQKKALNLFKTSVLAKNFYLAGGTALAEYYLQHRKSEDLDFFTQVESLYDIAVDKAQTISVRPRSRDFVDLFFILQKKKDWNFRDLSRKSQEKFEIVVDPLQLGENLLMVRQLADLPIMLKKIDLKAMKEFFLAEARKLKTEILR